MCLYFCFQKRIKQEKYGTTAWTKQSTTESLSRVFSERMFHFPLMHKESFAHDSISTQS